MDRRRLNRIELKAGHVVRQQNNRWTGIVYIGDQERINVVKDEVDG